MARSADPGQGLVRVRGVYVRHSSNPTRQHRGHRAVPRFSSQPRQLQHSPSHRHDTPQSRQSPHCRTTAAPTVSSAAAAGAGRPGAAPAPPRRRPHPGHVGDLRHHIVPARHRLLTGLRQSIPPRREELPHRPRRRRHPQAEVATMTGPVERVDRRLLDRPEQPIVPLVPTQEPVRSPVPKLAFRAEAWTVFVEDLKQQQGSWHRHPPRSSSGQLRALFLRNGRRVSTRPPSPRVDLTRSACHAESRRVSVPRQQTKRPQSDAANI